jgi:hypothetical protein
MAKGPWWAVAIQWLAWWLLVALVLGWLARTRLSERPQSDHLVLEHPRSTLVIGMVCSGFFLALAFLSWAFPGKDGSGTISLTFLGFAALGVPIIAEYFRVRHRLDPGGLRYSPLISRSGFLPWSSVARVRYSNLGKWFRLEAADGTVVRVSIMLTGLPEFARTVLREVTESRIDDGTRSVLERTAAGFPPSIWA